MIVRSYAAPVDTVTHDAGARRLVVIDATVTSGASGDALAAEQLWLSAAVVAFAPATWTTILRPETAATA